MVSIRKEPKKIYIYQDVTPITTAGIYHNSDLGLISLSGDGSTWITISDKNLGATTVWNYGDTLSEANCGKYYQWGNNYGFWWDGTFPSNTTSQVDANNYGPILYYNYPIFRKASVWDSSNNNNLRGWVTGTNEAMRGPCPEGYHIPTGTEWSNVITIWTTLGGGSSDGTNFGKYLKLPFAGYRDSSNIVYYQNGRGSYWTCVNYSTNQAFYLYVGNSIYPSTAEYRGYGLSIRPFKNDSVQPRAGTEWTKLY